MSDQVQDAQFQGHTPSQQPLQQQMKKSKGPIWMALLALIAGIAAIVVALIPGPFAVRVAALVLGFLIAVAGVVLGVISLNKNGRKALALSGIIVSGFSALLIAAFASLWIIANYQIEANIAKNEAELEARLAEEQAAEEARFAKSEWLDEAREEADLDAYVELDAATLADIAANPSAYEGQEFILKATMGSPLIHEQMWAEGLCIAQATGLPATGEPGPGRQLIALVDRGGEDECPIVDRLLGLEEGQMIPSPESLKAEHLLWVSPFGMIEGPDGEMPLFVVVDSAE